MIIPATHTEIEQLFLSAELSGCRSLCITGCQSGDGVTSIATALTERFLLAGKKTLLVDMNTQHPAFEAALDLSVESNGAPAQLIEHHQTHQLFTGLTIPKAHSTLLNYKDPQLIKHYTQQWLTEFDRVIFDTSPILHLNRNSIPAQVIASICDQTILVVMSGKTTSGQLEKAVHMLNGQQASLLGTVLNLKQHASLGQELSRQVERFKIIPAQWRRRWIDWLSTHPFLSQSA
jgi:Mrp family chromosome partitioning ATPase